jgi:hypothetical protein
LENALRSQIYLENLPIIGTPLSSTFQQGEAALKKFGALEANVKQALINLDNLPNRTGQPSERHRWRDQQRRGCQLGADDIGQRQFDAEGPQPGKRNVQ